MNLVAVTLLTLTVLFPALFLVWGALMVCAYGAHLFLARKASVNLRVVTAFMLLMLLGGWLVLLNVLRFADPSPATYWIGGFFVWLLFILLLRDLKDAPRIIHGAMVVSALVAGAGNLAYISAFLAGIAPEPISFPGYQAYFGLDARGFFAYSTSHLPLVGVLVPYFAYRGANSTTPLPKLEQFAVALLAVTGVMSLRSVIWVIVSASFVYYAWRRWGIARLVATSMATMVIGATLVAVIVDSDVLEGIYELKWEQKLSGEDLRYNQLVFWFNSFLDAPLVGHGLSSTETVLEDIATGDVLFQRPGPIANPYGYEILYGKWLSDIGLVLLIYVGVFAWFTFLAPAAPLVEVGALRLSAFCMLLQSATNSYLQASGYLFVLMLPIVFAYTKTNRAAAL